MALNQNKSATSQLRQTCLTPRSMD